MAKKSWFFLIMTLICLSILVNTFFVLPRVFETVGKEYLQPRVLNSLLLVRFLSFGVLYGLERKIVR